VSVATEPSAQPERRPNPRGQGARLREEILAATTALMADGEATTLRSIARRASVSAPAIYRHFRDVDDIMAALADDAFDALVATLVQERDQHEAPEARLRAVGRAYLSFATQRPELYRLMFGGVWSAPAAIERRPDRDARLRAMGMDALAVIVEAIGRCAEAGLSSSTDHHRDATALWVGLHGYAELRQNARLFPWPEQTEHDLVTALARLHQAT
jgi:AcrR family transcriptional regulator